jgi:pyruvate,water dikinase
MGLAHPLIRRCFAELGRRLVQNGAIERADDIYWLEESEVEALVTALDSDITLPNFSARIPDRKAMRREAQKVIPPAVLPETSRLAKLIPWSEQRQGDQIVLKGFGASPGKITAPACVIFGPQDFHRMTPGNVLVAVTTTPAWTPLFAMASAVVTDIGGPLSHSSIVAREYSIPAVMAVGVATRRIQDGQLITVDGSAGIVTLSSSPDGASQQG